MTVTGEEGNAYLTEDGKILDLMQIVCKDIISISADELDKDEMCFSDLYRTLLTDIKIIGINFPTDTNVQIQYVRERMEKTENRVYLAQLQKRLDELEYLHQFITAREYYLMFFSDDTDKYRENKSIIIRCLNQGSTPLIREITKEKKDEILYRMLNVNVMTG